MPRMTHGIFCAVSIPLCCTIIVLITVLMMPYGYCIDYSNDAYEYCNDHRIDDAYDYCIDYSIDHAYGYCIDYSIDAYAMGTRRRLSFSLESDI